ncbi:MAG: hypothetical protein KDE59_11805, partial [Anaerolineales bacterium]|nr:hypothetical protein [Anaerolineales bacterium]
MGKTSRVMQWLLLVGVLVGCNGGAEIPAGPTTSPALPDATATSQPLPATQLPPTSEPTTDAAKPPEPVPATATAATAAPAPVVAQGEPLRRQLLSSYTFPDALSIAASLAEDGTLYIAVGQNSYLYVARSTDGGVTFADLVQVS